MYFYLNLLVLISVFWIDLAHSADQPRMPSLANALGPLGSYHMMSEMELADSKQRLIIEEWGSLDTGRFRLDLVTMSERKTYLIYGDTGEIFRYQPFSCVTMKDHSDDLGVLAKMFKKFNVNKNNRVNKGDSYVFGVGPLWMLAEKIPDKRYLKAKDKPTRTRPQLYSYHRFTVAVKEDTSDNDDFPFDLNLYFTADDSPDGDSTSASNKNLESGFIEMLEWVDANKQVEARAKVVYLDLHIDEQHMSIFEIPEGYGCMRSADFDHPLFKEVDFVSINYDEPHQMSMEISAAIPREDGTQWNTHTATVKFLRGKLGVSGEKYQIMETQERDEDFIVKRVKKIWDYSHQYHNLLYSIDEETNECTISKVYDDTEATVEFASKAKVFPHAIQLDLDTINGLFTTNNGEFHLLKEIDLPNAGQAKTYVHERRLDKFTAGTLSGSASIIRRTTVPIGSIDRPVGEANIENYLAKIDRYKSSATIFIYDDQRKRILGKLTFKIFDHLTITKIFLHKQLDISDCIEDNKKEYATIKYPLESSKWANQLSTELNNVYNQFVARMYYIMGLWPTQVSQIAITFDHYYMYIRFLILDRPNKLMLFKQFMDKIVILPTNGDERINLKTHVATTAEKCARICETYFCVAFSYCNNRNCVILSGNFNDSEEQILSKFTESNTKCSLYLDDNMSTQSDTKPDHVIHRMSEIIKSSTDYQKDKTQEGNIEDAVENLDSIAKNGNKNILDRSIADYLNMYVYLTKMAKETNDILVLAPIAIDTDLMDIDDFFVAEHLAGNDLALIDESTKERHWLEDKLVHAEYTLEIEGQRLKVPKNNDKQEYIESDHLTYDDCSILCQDNNCLSFSYCGAEQSCVTSKSHNREAINLASQTDAHCNIFFRDYLTKFERFPNVQRPYRSRTSLKAISPRECATNCMDNKQMNCLSFEFCNTLDGNNTNCYLHGFHGRSLASTVGEVSGSDEWLVKLEKSARIYCHRYIRNYIADFDKFPNMGLDLEAASPTQTDQTRMVPATSQKLISDLDTETCAKMCIENDKCTGFTACFDPTSSLKLSCLLAKAPMKREYIISKQKCNTYLLSKKSEFSTSNRHVNPLPKEIIPSETALPQDDTVDELGDDSFDGDEDKINDNKHNSPLLAASGSGWLYRFSFMLLGMVCGCSLIYAYQNKQRIQQTIQNIRAR